MRKLIVSMNCTLDGYLSGPNCEMDWHFKYWNEEMGMMLCRELNKADTVLMGRNTYHVFSKFAHPDLQHQMTGRENLPFFDMLNRYQKIVFSKTLRQADWRNSIVCQTSIKAKITTLKMQEGKNMILYGSAKLLHCLQPLGLIDSYQLYYHPVLLGEGKKMFVDNCLPNQFELKRSQAFSNGVVFYGNN